MKARKKKGMIPPPVVTQALEDLAKLKAKKAKLPRPTIPLKAKLEAALHQLADFMHEVQLECDHDPALELREFDPKTGKYTPDANDPIYLTWRGKGAHDKKTHGPGGEKRITTKGSDNHTRERTEHLSESERKHRERMAAKGKAVLPRRM